MKGWPFPQQVALISVNDIPTARFTFRRSPRCGSLRLVGSQGQSAGRGGCATSATFRCGCWYRAS